jgi:hypothetical protein
MGLFHLGGDNALFQEFTVDYYPYQNRTALLFSSDAGRTWAQPGGGDAYDSLSCMNVAHPGKGCSPAVASPGCECTWMVNPTSTPPVQGRRGVRGYRVPMDARPAPGGDGSSGGGLVDYNTSTTAEFSATPSGEFMLKQATGLPLRFVGLPRAWDGSEVQLNPIDACNTIVLPDGSQLMCALVGSAGCWGASTSATCMALNRTGLSDNGCTSELACPGPTLIALQSMDGDKGQLWQFKGIIYQARSIFVETNLAVLSDSKTLIAVIRISGNGGCGTVDNPTDPVADWHTSTDYRWYHQSYSTDMGATWTKPAPIVGAGCCRPRLVAFPGGPLVLAGGRMCVAGVQGLFLWVSWNGMGSWNGAGHGDGSVDEWVPISISDAHNCGLNLSAPDYQQFTEAVNASSGWQTQAELGFVAIGDPASREALLTYNRYGHLPGPPPPGCSPPQAPCASIAFSMRVSFNANSTAARCSRPACSAAQGAKLATEYCQSPIYQGPKPKGEDCPGGSTNQTTATWLALKSGPGTPEWRCYSLAALNAAHTAYQGPSREFCSEGAILQSIVKSCKLPPVSGHTPTPTPTPPLPVLPFHVIPTPSNGDILVRGPTLMPADFASIFRQEPILGSKPGDYKPAISQLNNSDLLIVFRTHQPGPLHAVFLRSSDDGKSWVRDESQTHVRGNEFALHSLSDGSVLLIDGGNGTAAAVYRSTDWGHSFHLSQMIACKEMGWSVLEENGTWAPRGVYVFADRTIYHSTDTGLRFKPQTLVTDMSWHDGDSFFGQSTVFRSKISGILRHVTRVGVDPSWDQTDGSQLWHSLDPSGANWLCASQAAGGWCNGHSCAPTQHRQCSNVSATFG